METGSQLYSSFGFELMINLPQTPSGHEVKHHSSPCDGVLVMFLIAVTKYLARDNLRGNGFILVHSFTPAEAWLCVSAGELAACRIITVVGK